MHPLICHLDSIFMPRCFQLCEPLEWGGAWAFWTMKTGLWLMWSCCFSSHRDGFHTERGLAEQPFLHHSPPSHDPHKVDCSVMAHHWMPPFWPWVQYIILWGFFFCCDISFCVINLPLWCLFLHTNPHQTQSGLWGTGSCQSYTDNPVLDHYRGSDTRMQKRFHPAAKPCQTLFHFSHLLLAVTSVYSLYLIWFDEDLTTERRRPQKN